MGLAMIGHAAPFAKDLNATAELAAFGVGLAFNLQRLRDV